MVEDMINYPSKDIIETGNIKLVEKQVLISALLCGSAAAPVR